MSEHHATITWRRETPDFGHRVWLTHAVPSGYLSKSGGACQPNSPADSQ
jgi:hypothetical protein